MPQKWTSNEQEEFLTWASMLGGFCMRATDKKYEEFWKKSEGLFGDLPTDHILTPDQVKDWQTLWKVMNRDLRTAKNGHLLLQILWRKVKDTANAEIRVQNVTDHGPKLNKCCVYSEECEEVKNKVERTYQKAKAKHAKARLRQKSGKMPKIDDT
ncbi:hypothetical protein EV702DRAFT_1040893 [Suillus placidus]|uniref:Uncharacterized protein n=1 Tax=Suillus placidus TaxID=48579 RepID=A0A9P7D957_9AGAM|nr:hypothetical protein EV702DRAFT_1040893 [Suillus placidus]